MTIATETFEGVADVLVSIRPSDRVKRYILAATMDAVGVPMMSLSRYGHDVAIVELFAEQGVTFVKGATCICGCLLGKPCTCAPDAEHGDPRTAGA